MSMSSAFRGTEDKVQFLGFNVGKNSVIDVGDGILNLQSGMAATCTPQDWGSMESEWVWVTSHIGSGWVPREFLRIV